MSLKPKHSCFSFGLLVFSALFFGQYHGIPQASAAELQDFTNPFAGISQGASPRPALIILVRASDRPPTKTRAQIRGQFFGTGENVANYLNEISYGRFTLSEAYVTDWLVPDNDPNTPNIDESHSDFIYKGGRPAELAKAEWLIETVDKKTNFDFTRYDTNPRDGRVTEDELLVFWVYPGGSVGRSREVDPHLLKVEGLSQGIEIRQLSRAGDQSPWPLFAHELLHQMYSLKDEYIDDSKSYPGVGSYSIMCADRDPVGLDPFSKIKLGWVQPRLANKDGWYTLLDAGSSPDALIVHDPSRGSKDYFILENRWQGVGSTSAMDQIPDSGLAIWRISERFNASGDDWARKTIDRIWADGVPSTSGSSHCPDKSTSVFQGDHPGLSYAITPSSSPAKLEWRDGTNSNIGIWFVSNPGSMMRIYVDVPPVQVGLYDDTLYHSAGSSRDLVSALPLSRATAAKGASSGNLAGIGIARDGHTYAWYYNGRVSAGDIDSLGNYRPTSSFVLPSDRSPTDIVGMGISSHDHVYAWYRDGTVSAGSSRDLGSYRSPRPYSLAEGKTPNDVLGMGIAGDDHVYVWYRDGTVSAGSSTDLDNYRPARGFRLPPGWHPSRITATAIGANDRVHAWYAPDAPRNADIDGPIVVGAYAHPGGVRPGQEAEIVVRAHLPDGRPLSGQVELWGPQGEFTLTQSESVVGMTGNAGFYKASWRAPTSLPSDHNSVPIYVIVKDGSGNMGAVQIDIPIITRDP